MKIRSRFLSILLVFSATLAPLSVGAEALPSEQAPIDWKLFQSLWLDGVPRATPEEPRAAAFSEETATHFLDDVALRWVRKNQCGTCHTTVSYLMAHPQFGRGQQDPVRDEVRAGASAFALNEAQQKTGISTIIAGAAVAAFTVGDAPGSELPADTRALFDYLWTTQRPDGSWGVDADGLLPFLERDPRYLALMVTLAMGYAPKEFREEKVPAAGLERLQGFLRRNPPDNLHDQAVLLWASVRTPGVLTPKQRTGYLRSLLALQRADGGWSLPSMGNWKRHGGTPNPKNGPSDGYATALATLALCETGTGTSMAPAQRGVQWLRTNQRESGRWFTASLFADGFQNYLSNMATAYALMAMHSCDARGQHQAALSRR
ncbi:MAG: hypothetical protein RJB26_1046 [Pseudomonadota bacterium]